MNNSKTKKLRYPKYINGIKQIQCPFKRMCMRIWYSEWFRIAFILCPIWLIVLMIMLMISFPSVSELIRYLCLTLYVVLFTTALAKNDWSELRRIGLDEYHRPLKPTNEDLERS